MRWRTTSARVIKSGVARGHVQIHVALTRTGGRRGPREPRAARRLHAAPFAKRRSSTSWSGQPDLNAALRIPGMLGTGEEQELGDELAKAVLEAAAEAVAVLNAFREREGAATAAEMRQRCREHLRAGRRGWRRSARAPFRPFRSGCAKSWPTCCTAPASNRSAWRRRPPSWPTAAISPRNWSACAPTPRSSRTMLAADGEIGKRLDFLLQEMNRESNTVLSKTGGLGDLGLTITDLALARKVGNRQDPGAVAESGVNRIRPPNRPTMSACPDPHDHCFHHLRALRIREIDAGGTPAGQRARS